MYAPIEPLFWIYAFYFILATFLAFFIPGHLLVIKLKLNLYQETVLSFVVGYVLWSLQGFVFGYFSLRGLTYLYLFICFLVWLKFCFPVALRTLKEIRFKKPSFVLFLITILGTAIQLSSVWVNGFKIEGSVFFCCGVPDTLTYLALVSELVRRFPPNEPGISGYPLYNYHYLSNLGLSELIRIFHLPLINTAYQYMTLLFSVFLGLTVIAFSDVLDLGRKFKVWILFLVYFAGDIIFFLPFISGKGFNFSLTTLENASSLWISPPRFYSIVIFFAGITLLAIWLKKKNMLAGLIMALVLGSLVGFKVYTGLIILSGFAVLGLFYFFKKRFNLIIPIIALFLISLCLYLPVNKDAGGLVFTGFWRFEDFIVQPSLQMSNFELARRVYLENDNYVKVLIYDLFFGFLYIFFSAGVLILGIFQTKNSLKKIPKDLNTVLLVGLLTTCVAGFFFIQQTGGANSSQFLISIYVIGVVYAALMISWWQNKIPKKIGLLLSFFLILLISGRVFHDTNVRIDRIFNRTGFNIDNDKLESYNFFNNTSTNSIVMVSDESTLDCLYIIFIGNRSTYNCSSGLPGVIDEYELTRRKNVKNNILYGEDFEKVRKEIKLNKINYLYVPKNEENKTNIEKLELIRVFETSSISVYRF